MKVTKLKTADLIVNEGQIEGVPSNPRQWTRGELARLKKSLQETPELFEARGILVYPHGGKYIVIGGNMRLSASKELGLTEVPCIVIPEDTPAEKLRELVIKDNGAFGQWDFDMLANEWDDLPLTEWGVPAWDTSLEDETKEQEEIERKKKEFEERIKAGEISEEDEEYQAFLDKFKLAKTTDDCFTPALVYDAVAKFVAKKYGKSPAKFVRPFYPGGDFEKFDYPQGCVVVDNPPFSILAKILNFYDKRGISFFLFAPTLTLFSSSSSCTALPLSVSVTYENAATVNTSFLTNLEPNGVRLRSEPELYRLVKAANDANLKEMKKELPRYSYDHHIITSPFVAALSRLGIDFTVPVAESEPISQLDCQKASGKAIYGKGYIVGDRVFAEREKAEREKAEREKAEREKAEREKAEREKAERWELSDRERAIVARLSATQ